MMSTATVVTPTGICCTIHERRPVGIHTSYTVDFTITNTLVKSVDLAEEMKKALGTAMQKLKVQQEIKR